MQIQGTLSNIRFQKENGWGIFNVTYKDENGNKEIRAFTGVIVDAQVGATYNFDGDFMTHPQYGDQFQFKTCLKLEKETADGAFALLTSNRFSGIGARRALAIVEYFGDRTLDVIRNHPEELMQVSGVGEAIAMNLHKNIPDIGVWEQLRMLLRDSTDNAVNKIYETYREKSVEVIKRNPYTLIKDIDGYGFLKADAIAKNLGIADDAPIRVEAAIYYCLETAASKDGHCYSYATTLQSNLERMIPGVNFTVIANAIKSLTSPTAGRMQVHVDTDGAIYLQDIWLAESRTAEIVRAMLDMKPVTYFTQSDVDNAAVSVMHETGITLDETQRDAVLGALNQRISTITGGPGTGKTTIIKTMIKAISNVCGDRAQIFLCAPTGKAAVRMREATGHDASTIHRLCIVQRYAKENTGRHAQHSYFIVDEASMIDIKLAYLLLNTAGVDNASIIFIGDIDQLPPVGPGVFFRDLITSYKVPTVRLKFSFRQHGSIAQNANKMNEGQGPHAYITDENFQLVSAKKATGPKEAIKHYFELVDEFGIDNVVLLSPTRKRGDGCTNELNKVIQAMRFPMPANAKVLKTGDFEIIAGDRVMLTQNSTVENHENGDVGTVLDITDKIVTVLFDDEKTPSEIGARIAAGVLTLAYATTVHKSQGSEYDGVVVLFTTEHQFMGERSLLYTALTRAKRKCCFVCDARAVNAAIAKVKPIARNSKLMYRIND